MKTDRKCSVRCQYWRRIINLLEEEDNL